MKYLTSFITGRPHVLTCAAIIFFLASANLMLFRVTSAWSDEGIFYTIHLLSLQEAEVAKAKVKEFNDLGYNAFYRQETTDGKTNIYNVYIERYPSRAEAEKEANVLKELALISEYDVRELSENTKTNIKNTDKEQKTVKPVVKRAAQQTRNNKQDEKKSKQSAGGYYIKVSSLKEKNNAEDLVKKLQDSGYPAFFSYEEINGKDGWYRVYIDGYKSKGDAIKAGKKLKGSGIISGYEVRKSTDKIHIASIDSKDEKKVYGLHISSYKESSHADEDIQRLTEYGLKAYLEETEVSGEKWFRVYAGDFPTEAEARKLGEELKKKGMISYFKPVLKDKK
jgi:cell division septation protein DedD